MGLRDRLRFVTRAAQSFTAPADLTPIDQIIVAAKRSGWSLTVSRETALMVPAVLRGRNLLCSVATLPLVQYDPAGARAASSLLSQPDPQVAPVITLAQTVEDLLFDGLAWWRVTARGWNDFPSQAQHVEASRVHLNPPPGAQSLNLLPSGADPAAAVWIDTEVVDGRDMIRFDSPNPPFLVAARRAIRRAVLLEAAAERYAKNPRPLDYFTPTEGADPADDDEVKEILDDWLAAREDGSTAYVPESLDYHTVQVMSPADLQLVGLQTRAALDLANSMGIDPEDLGINVTSRTYQNVQDRRIDRVNDVLGPYMSAITGRLGMNDVTRRGYTVAFDLTQYLRADPTTAANVSSTLAALKAITRDEIRARNGLPPLTPAQRAELDKAAAAPAAAATPSAQGVPVQNTAPLAVRFAAGDPQQTTGEHFVFEPGTFAVDAAKRTITGEVIPYGKVGQNYSGRWLFEPGSITWNTSAVSRVKMNDNHYGQPFGAATTLRSTPTAVEGAFKIGRGALGDQMLTSAEDGIRDGLSAEVVIKEYTIDRTGDAPLNRVTAATLTGVALTATPAFDDARVTKVAASTGGMPTMRCSTCGLEHAAGTPCPTPTPTPAPPAPAPAPAAGFTADQLAAIGAAAAAALAGTEGPTPINPRRPGSAALTVVRNELAYGFNGFRREHDFSTDLFAVLRSNDGEAKARLEKFMVQAFGDDVSTGDVNELNPTRNRPDLYVDNLEFLTPIWDAINKGSIADSTPFTVPKFNAAATLVSAHVEGTEPTAGTFTTTGQTITPSAVSGKVEITRETIDQGGNPQVSTIIWREIVRAYNEGLEVAAVNLLDGLTPSAMALTGTDADLDQNLTAALAALQYIRGGFRFSRFFLASTLFAALAGAVDDNGRKLFPLIAPQNASGQAVPQYAYLNVGGQIARPAWALEVANGGEGSSYLFSPDDVHGWATAPRQFNFEYEVKSVWLGVMGYLATANTRLAGVREVTYA